MDEKVKEISRVPEEMLAELISRFMWIFFASTTIGLIILIETLLLNRACG